MGEGKLGKTYFDGEFIFKEGELGNTMYVIQSGKVDITKETGKEGLTIATLGAGDIFGEMSLFDKMPRSANAVAHGEANILSVDKKKLFSMIDRDPTMVFKLLETMSQRIRKLNGELIRLKEVKVALLYDCSSIDNTCDLILEKVNTMISSENGSIMRLEEDGNLSIVSAFGMESEMKLNLTRGRGIAGDVLKTGKAELVNNVSLDSRFIPGQTSIKSMLCAPLRCRNDFLGVINLSNSSDRLFTIEDLKLLSSLSAQASIAIQNSGNFETLKNATERVLQQATILDM